jgi:hypothetical protein
MPTVFELSQLATGHDVIGSLFDLAVGLAVPEERYGSSFQELTRQEVDQASFQVHDFLLKPAACGRPR